MNPLNGQQLVPKRLIAGSVFCARIEQTEHSQPVVEWHEDYAISGEFQSVVDIGAVGQTYDTGTNEKTPSMNVDKDWRVLNYNRRPYVQVKTVLAVGASLNLSCTNMNQQVLSQDYKWQCRTRTIQGNPWRIALFSIESIYKSHLTQCFHSLIAQSVHDAKFLYEADVLIIESISNTFINIDSVILWSSLSNIYCQSYKVEGLLILCNIIWTKLS